MNRFYTASTDGYLSSTDWNAFNGRLSTTTLGLFDKGYFFSTTSAHAWGATKGYSPRLCRYDPFEQAALPAGHDPSRVSLGCTIRSGFEPPARS